eukprot:scaffold7221_cov165-Amphora_coffeaeformis.AAC.10
MADDDPLQAALTEAQQFMHDLGVEGDDDNNGNGFSIDSDDDIDEEDVTLNKSSASAGAVPDDPLSLAVAEVSSGTTGHPLQDATSFKSVPSPTSAPLPASNNGLMGQPQPPSPGTNTPMHPHASHSAASVAADAFKQQTSRFAFNLANMAQRAATQMQSIGVAGVSPSHHHGMSSPPQGVAYGSGYNNGGYATTLPNQGSMRTTTSTSSMTTSATSQPPQASPPAPGLDKEQQAALIQTHVGDLLPGEKVIMFLSNLLHVSDSTGFSYSHTVQPSTLWCCAMTYYRLLLFGTHPSRPPSKPSDWHASCWPQTSVHLLEIPLASMEKVEKSVFTAQTGQANNGGNANNLSNHGYSSTTGATTTTTLMGVMIQGKDNRIIRFTTTSYAETMRAYEALQTYAFPGRRNIGYLFAFESKKEAVMKSIETDPTTGQSRVTLPPISQRFNGLEEFQRQFDRRQQETIKPWAIYAQLNAQYNLCPSYPAILAGPASIDESNQDSFRILQQSAAFRSEQRLPALTWASGVDGASLWRCSQPKIGLQGNRSAADELLIKHIQEQAASANAMSSNAYKISLSASVTAQFTGVSPYNAGDVAAWMNPGCELKILDLRPRASAMANRTGGYGYENTSNYVGTTLQFCNIGNIHAVRDAYQKMCALCLAPAVQDIQWPSLVEDTKWLSSIRFILAASWETAFWIHVHRLPVLLHCSHGWDRTSQVAVIAQLLLDPYYRTCKGFACLVEKDFMAFGHPFHTRCAHGEGRSQDATTAAPIPNHDEGQVSPIFIQFLDAVFQVVNQYPEAFEFNAKYLVYISDHVYSCRFGNFLCDSERERERVAGLRQRTHSLWDHLDETAEAEGLLNKTFDAADSQGALLMPLPTLLRNVTMWVDRHARYGPGVIRPWNDSVIQ